MLGNLLVVGFLARVARAREVPCFQDDNAACSYVTEHPYPWGDPSSKPAPIAECMSASTEYTEDSGDGELAPSAFNIMWRQKWSDIDSIEGYFITYVTRITPEKTYEMKLDKEKLQAYRDFDEIYVTFNFGGIEDFESGTIHLYSLPMYNEDTKDFYHEITKVEEGKKLQESKGCDKGNEVIISTTQAAFTDQNATTRNVSTKGYQEVSLRITVMACIFTSVGTLLLLLAIVCVYATRCRGTDFLPEGKAQQRQKEKYLPGKPGVSGKDPSKVFIVTTMAEDENEDGSVGFYKRTALGLAEILRDSNLYDVSCNLWLTKEISNKGVAVWAHGIMRSYDVIIALCNKMTVVGLRRSLALDSLTDDLLGSDTEPSVQLLRRIVGNLSPQKTIIACVDDHHDCLAHLPLPSLEKCQQFNLNYQFGEFLYALGGNGEYYGGKTIATMQSKFLHMMMGNKSKYYPHLFGDKTDENNALAHMHESITTEGVNPCKLYLVNESKLSETDERSSPEAQYDSVFSSRCNSQSTETLSSREDAGIPEHNQKKVSHEFTRFQTTGARPKAQK